MDVTERVARVLACSAVDSKLTGLLFLNLDPALIHPLADWLADLLGDMPANRPPIIPIGPQMAEERLWERLTFHRAEHPGDLGFRWEPGPLARYDRPAGVVVVPDLAVVGLPASRAAVALIDAEVAHLQRSGISETWQPRDRWLAALRRRDVGHVSAHLLDRFAVRVSAGDMMLPRYGGPVLGAPDPMWRQAVLAMRAGAELPTLSAEVAEQVLDRVPARAPGARRDLALARLARALAALEGELAVLPAHVDHAAELAGLAAVLSTRRATPLGVARSGPSLVADGPAQADEASSHVSATPGGDPGRLSPVPAPVEDDDEVWTGPYPEDIAQPQRDVAPLRLGWQRGLVGQPRGAPIGTQRTLDKRDIAVTATLLNAARYQRLRCPEHYWEGHRLHVKPPDLLSYRRAPRPGHLLVLVLDHTCRTPDWDWVAPLAPYLRWAYVHRALVGVVEMGAATSDRDVWQELRASQFRARGVQDSKVLRALGRRPGRAATPLAHGLTLAAGMLRHDTQQAGALISQAFLVVITDGRANVPLAASQTALPPSDVVGGTAIADAEAAARKIGGLCRVRSAVIYPGPLVNMRYAASLAAALGGPLVRGAAGTSARHEAGRGRAVPLGWAE